MKMRLDANKISRGLNVLYSELSDGIVEDREDMEYVLDILSDLLAAMRANHDVTYTPKHKS